MSKKLNWDKMRADLDEIRKGLESTAHNLVDFSVAQGRQPLLYVTIPNLETQIWKGQGVESYQDIGIDLQEIHQDLKDRELYPKPNIDRGFKGGATRVLTFAPDHEKYQVK
jgi:hypothetical protein